VEEVDSLRDSCQKRTIVSIQSFYSYEGNEMREDMCNDIPGRGVWVGVSLIPFYADNATDGLVNLLSDLNCPFWLLDSNAISHPLWYVTRGWFLVGAG
jgi:hypothetical protein